MAAAPQQAQSDVEESAEVPDIEVVAWFAERLVPKLWEQGRTVQRQMGQTVELTKYKFEKGAMEVFLRVAASGSFADAIFLCLAEV